MSVYVVAVQIDQKPINGQMVYGSVDITLTSVLMCITCPYCYQSSYHIIPNAATISRTTAPSLTLLCVCVGGGGVDLPLPPPLTLSPLLRRYRHC